ncbi:hypothetical protein OIU76_021979 [Salix suchowensis]|nr:hypothetical protein OIU76_021979 [Salix suchowensis]
MRSERPATYFIRIGRKHTLNRDFDKVIEEKNDGNVLLDLKSLKEIHGWADFSLIEDVMKSVDNDAAKAFVLLNGMVSNADFDEEEGAKFNSGFNKSLADDIADLSSTLEDALKCNDHNNDKNNMELREDEGVSSSVDAAANMKLILGHLKSIPVEPEWEEDDLYLSHRKNALRMMRLASRHSRAATNAFLRRDHSSAQQHSLRAQEKWSAAEQLNAQAAKEILSIRNSGNDPWKLDLHAFRQRRISVQVITGVGNHSRGQAVLKSTRQTEFYNYEDLQLTFKWFLRKRDSLSCFQNFK